MRWEKLGKVFDFESSCLSRDFISHAQSPQALVFDDFVRVYFSTRKKDVDERFVSCVRFVDFDKTMKTIVNTSQQDVVETGELGAFDEHGIFPFSPLRHQGKIYGYTTGWSRRVSVDVALGIGLTESDDGGRTFRRLGSGPVLTASLREPFLVCDGFVRVFDDVFHMFYIFGTNWSRSDDSRNPERTYVMGHATSSDGVDWTKEERQIIPSKFGDECHALPTVIRIGSVYHMFFCYRTTFDFRNNPRNGYRIGYACAEQLDHWVRDDEMVGIEMSPSGWDSQMLCYPHVFQCDDNIFMLYNGNEFGRHGFGLAKLCQ